MSAARSRASAISSVIIMRRRVSMRGPKAFSIRSAMSGEGADRALSRAERAGRVTPRILAAWVTDRPRGSITSILMNWPGWAGRAIRIRVPLSVIGLIIQVDDFSFARIDSKHGSPVAGDGQAPGSLAVAGKLMRFPTRDVAELLGVFHVLEQDQNIPNLLEYRGHS